MANCGPWNSACSNNDGNHHSHIFSIKKSVLYFHVLCVTFALILKPFLSFFLVMVICGLWIEVGRRRGEDKGRRICMDMTLPIILLLLGISVNNCLETMNISQYLHLKNEKSS